MPNFWDYKVFDNSLRSYVIVAATILFVIVLKRFISRLIGRFIFSFVRKMDSGLDRTDFLKLVVGPIGTFLVVLVTMSSIEKLHFPSTLDFDIYEVKVRAIVQAVAVIIIIVSFIWLLMRLVDFIAVVLRKKARTGRVPRDNQMIVFIRDFLKAIIGIIGILMVLDEAFKVNVSTIVASLGLATAAFALAAKESIENLIASFVIFFDKPFTAGDYLKVNNVQGTVEKIGLRSTRIRTDQKTYVTVPNKQMVDSVVDNLSLRTQRKGELRLELSLSSAASDVEKYIAAIKLVLTNEHVEGQAVFLHDITGRGFLVNVDYFTPPVTLEEFNAVKERINLEVLRIMEKMGLSIAGSGTTVTLVREDSDGVASRGCGEDTEGSASRGRGEDTEGSASRGRG